MFNPNDFRPITSSSEMLGGIPGLNAQQELTWARASQQAKEYIKKAERDGKDLVKRTPDGSMDNILGGISGIASGISGLGSLGAFGGGGGAPATQGIGPVADGAVYGGMLDSMKGLGGMGPVASGATYGAFLDSPRRTSGAFGW